jgi:hypothetical protein
LALPFFAPDGQHGAGLGLESMQGHPRDDERFPLAWTLFVYTVAFFALAWPWLSGTVAIPYDGKSTFYPQLAFLARSFAEGQSPFWTPNVFAGWPQIADPQSLIFSPLYVLVALLNPAPSPWLADAVVFALLYAGGFGVILIFRDRRWHAAGALVAALAFAFGGSAASRIQHIGQVESLVFLPLALWALARALDRGSWPAGCGAGLLAAMIVLGRDQVALIGIYVLLGYVLWHWFDGAGVSARIVSSIKPLAAGAVVGLLIIAVPVTLTVLLKASSNRPEIGLFFAGRGSLHPAHLFMLVFADLFGASDFNREFWGPPSFPWLGRFGSTDLFVPQNAGQIYAGALAVVAVLRFGLLRGQLWAREIRFFTVAMGFALLYALGKYTPAFEIFYGLLPGVSLFRRPADATFVFCGLLAIIAGYLVHRRLTDGMPPPDRWQHALATVLAVAIVAGAVGLAFTVGMLQGALLPLAWGVAFIAAAMAALELARDLGKRSRATACMLLAAFSVADFAWNNAPNESTGLPPKNFEALAPDTKDETVAFLKSRLAAAEPDRHDRVELIGVGYHWPNIGLIHDFDHLFGHNPLRLKDFVRATGAPDTVAAPDQRGFTPLLPSYRSTLEDLFGVRFIAVGVPVEQIDSALKPGDLKLIARTKDAYVYENPRALPRVMLVGDWRHANFEDMLQSGFWPDFDPRRIVLLEKPPGQFVPGGHGGEARLVRYRNTEVVIETVAEAPSLLVLNDVWHPWWRVCVDGAAADMLKANVLFRAVVVPGGRHIVRFAFHPLGETFGKLLPASSEPRC